MSAEKNLADVLRDSPDGDDTSSDVTEDTSVTQSPQRSDEGGGGSVKKKFETNKIEIGSSKASMRNDVTDSKSTNDEIIELSNDMILPNVKGHSNMAYSDSEDGEEDDEFDERRDKRTKAIVSFVIDDVGQEEKEIKKLQAREGRRKEDLSSALSSDLSIIYGAILSLIGLALPLTEALRNKWMTTTTVGAFNVYIYSVSSIFLIYISIYMGITNKRDSSKRGKENHTVEGHQEGMQEAGGVVMFRMVNPPAGRTSPDSTNENDMPFSSYDGKSSQPQDRKASIIMGHQESVQSTVTSISDIINAENNYGMRRRKLSGNSEVPPLESQVNPLNDEIYDEIMVLHRTASLGHDGASFYLRLGALLFGMANFVYVIVQIEERFRQAGTGCLDLPEVYPMFFHLVFLVVQSFYIFKNTKIHLKSQKHLARFGFAHVLATNMCNWFRILVFEVMEGVYKTKKSMSENEHYNKTDYKSNKFPNETSCLHSEGIYYSMAPYLFPFVLEYSLVAAATMAGMYQSLNVIVTQDILQAVKKAISQKRHGPEYSHSHEHEDVFAKSHKGMFGGVILLAGALVAIIMFHFALTFDNDELKALRVYYWSDIILHAVLIPPVIYCAFKFSKFKFSYNRENTIDDFLLMLSMGGLILYNIFVTFTSVSGELFGGEYEMFDAASSVRARYLNLASAILNIVQCLIQGVFVIAGLQLCACSKEQSQEKPGRGAIALLILGNIALWFFKTFIVKEVSLHRFVDFFGPTAWPIIMNTTLPLVLFYRFHVSVCLADMWASVYKPETGPKYKALQ